MLSVGHTNTACLGSVLVSGSNPHADYTVQGVKFPTEYRVEYFYPSYYNERRPQPQGLLKQLSYGGPYFNVSLTHDDLAGDVNNIKNTEVILLRTGFSTHTMVRRLMGSERLAVLIDTLFPSRTWVRGSSSSTPPTLGMRMAVAFCTSARSRPTLPSSLQAPLVSTRNFIAFMM